MKKIIILLFVLVSSVNAQFSFTGDMGISFFNSPSLADYVNTNFKSSDELSTFNTNVDFIFETGYRLSPNSEIAIEYVFSNYSYTTSLFAGAPYEISFGHHKPSVVAYFVIPGKGFNFKLGGGAGLRILSVDEKIGTSKNYTATGFGLLLKAQGNTSLGGNLYANISAYARYDLPGEPENGSQKIENKVLNETLNINSFSVGIALGVSYSL